MLPSTGRFGRNGRATPTIHGLVKQMHAELLGGSSINWINWIDWSRCLAVSRGQNGVTKKTTVSYSSRVQSECILWQLLACRSSVLCCALAVGAVAIVGGVADSVVAVIFGLLIGAKYADRLD